MSCILAIETSGTTCGAAVVIDDLLASEVAIYRPHQHDEHLASCVRQALDHAGRNIGNVDIVAISAGPGSFTGLRIGASFVKGLCVTGTPKLVAVPTLSACAAAAVEVVAFAGATSIVATVVSHRDLVYFQRFAIDGTPHSASDFITVEEARSRISPSDLVCGPGASTLIDAPISGLTRLAPRFVARAARTLILDGQFTDPASFVPDYQQDFIPRGSA